MLEIRDNATKAIQALEKGLASGDKKFGGYRAAINEVLQEVKLKRSEAAWARERLQRLEAKVEQLQLKLNETDRGRFD